MVDAKVVKAPLINDKAYLPVIIELYREDRVPLRAVLKVAKLNVKEVIDGVYLNEALLQLNL
ncbi:MAG: hypothetical protein DRO09_00650 [Thermoprotei archaeon]|nr:MAG: hypothetical protein DRO09_00650 [Thermoprotei archaeon]